MNCQQAQRQMDDLLDARARRHPDELARHMSECNECRQAWTFAMEAEALRSEILLAHSNGFWKEQETAIRRRIHGQAANTTMQRRRGTVSVAALAAAVWLVTIRSPVETPQLPTPKLEVPHAAAENRPTTDRPLARSTPALPRLDRRSVMATITSRALARRHSRATKRPYMHIRVVQIVSARVALDEPTCSLPPRTLEIERIQSADGSERIEVRTVPVVVINPFVNQLGEEDQPPGG